MTVDWILSDDWWLGWPMRGKNINLGKNKKQLRIRWQQICQRSVRRDISLPPTPGTSYNKLLSSWMKNDFILCRIRNKLSYYSTFDKMDFLEEVSEHLETSVYRARERERDIVYYLWKFMLVIIQSCPVVSILPSPRLLAQTGLVVFIECHWCCDSLILVIANEPNLPSVMILLFIITRSLPS